MKAFGLEAGSCLPTLADGLTAMEVELSCFACPEPKGKILCVGPRISVCRTADNPQTLKPEAKTRINPVLPGSTSSSPPLTSAIVSPAWCSLLRGSQVALSEGTGVVGGFWGMI